MTENKKKYYKKYYEEHKEEILQKNREWRQANKEKFNQIIYKNRRAKAEKLKEQGVMYSWRTNKERERLYNLRNERINKRVEEETNNVNDEQ